MKNGNVMRHGEFNKYHSSFMISDSSHKPSKMFPTNKQNSEEKKKRFGNFDLTTFSM